ncbi:transmembrane protein 60 [Harpegnathos saltator]|uniref:Transmembrane protein 60 n=1 Tax=Harpegnathos saltator TaxID=610380 RepID=E2BQ95_HARSA|nr:transmembrane protein 60 [Harpegnathos saltator]EFN82149.1 Transmembrane protein 60 [Harpegnathos saltator]
MAILHRALFAWFNVLIFMIVLALRLDQKIQWNWFIVFIPLWLYDNFLLIYIVFNMISHCKNPLNRHIISLHRKAWYMTIVLMFMCAKVLICLKLEAPHWFLPGKIVVAPFWLLLPALTVDIFIHLIQHSRY